MPRLRPAFVPLAAAALLAATALLPKPARAQINPFRNYSGPVLSREDRAAGREAAERLLAAPSPQVGAWESWTGATSGNSGVVEIERIYRRNGLDCRTIRSTVQFKAGSDRAVVLQACNVGGRWKLAD